MFELELAGLPKGNQIVHRVGSSKRFGALLVHVKHVGSSCIAAAAAAAGVGVCCLRVSWMLAVRRRSCRRRRVTSPTCRVSARHHTPGPSFRAASGDGAQRRRHEVDRTLLECSLRLGSVLSQGAVDFPDVKDFCLSACIWVPMFALVPVPVPVPVLANGAQRGRIVGRGRAFGASSRRGLACS